MTSRNRLGRTVYTYSYWNTAFKKIIIKIVPHKKIKLGNTRHREGHSSHLIIPFCLQNKKVTFTLLLPAAFQTSCNVFQGEHILESNIWWDCIPTWGLHSPKSFSLFLQGKNLLISWKNWELKIKTSLESFYLHSQHLPCSSFC